MAQRTLVGHVAALGTRSLLPAFSGSSRSCLSSASLQQHISCSQAFRSNLKPISRSPSCLLGARRTFFTSIVKKDEQKPDFKAQLWESTTARVQKERDEQDRYARGRMERAGASGGATSLGFTLGIAHIIHPFPLQSLTLALVQPFSWPPASATT